MMTYIITRRMFYKTLQHFSTNSKSRDYVESTVSTNFMRLRPANNRDRPIFIRPHYLAI